MKKIAFTGGGTGGHVYPALAIAETLKEKDSSLQMMWIGQKNGVEQKLAEQAAIPFYGISAGKLRRYFSLQNITDIFKIFLGYFQAKKFLKKEKPDLLFSKGGFVSVPPVIAARKLGIPVFIHESDSDPGLANRIAARYATAIFVPYEETKQAFNQTYQDKIFISGNPVRSAVWQADRTRGRALYNLQESDQFILVLGGSSGAKQVNDLVASLAPELSKQALIVHQMGDKLYQPSDIPGYITLPYIHDELPDLMAAADIIISRAGAGAVWEFAVVGAVPIFIPLGMRGDQARNAALLERRGACVSLTGDLANPETLKEKILFLLNNRDKRLAMAREMKNLVTFDSKLYLADKILECLKPPINKEGGE